ncbi:aminotransferase class I/II-fold pyridoxal phosphate-dependent enzyme [Exiguobacterium sp. TBG-PICH-001]|uniref:threonine aldolase family protein n=1 Tax=Exiguobacterium abrahamii TaxID=2785532 RepID=UPI0018A72A7F|nr:aminotransferase class I/II-fold pyridoxal phosphate-dependent enzyme [Exiguobacterium sp. TBG-PICH-001]MBF8153066.1 aminotransferase class I/II-fold pyridoxal phosphate-dependent enzyme [Exiguobacterium sp. TBG-PICH-001]
MDLRSSYQKTTKRLDGHGSRTVGVLQEALRNVSADQPSDIYGNGELIKTFERKMVDLLGHDDAVFFPSGTMAQQIALRIWSDEQDNRKVAYHPLCHLEIHEQDGLKKLHGIEPVLVGEADRLMSIDDVKALPDVSCLLLELPQRELGGLLPSREELEVICAYARKQNIRLHLDGARLLEVLPYYEAEAKDIAQLFDSVYISFYKGLGGVAGAILAGPESFCQEARIWKRRYGGDLISLYPYILSADFYYEQRKDRMAEYHASAKELASSLNAISGISTRPLEPVSNMFHLYFKAEKAVVEEKLIEIQSHGKVGIAGYLVEKDGGCATEVNIGDSFLALTPDERETVYRQLTEAFSED